MLTTGLDPRLFPLLGGDGPESSFSRAPVSPSPPSSFNSSKPSLAGDVAGVNAALNSWPAKGFTAGVSGLKGATAFGLFGPGAMVNPALSIPATGLGLAQAISNVMLESQVREAKGLPGMGFWDAAGIALGVRDGVKDVEGKLNSYPAGFFDDPMADNSQGKSTGISESRGTFADDLDKSDPGASEDKVICGALYRLGYMDEATYRADEAFGRAVRKVYPDLLAGYQVWARPLAEALPRHPLLARVVWKVVRPWAQHMSFKMGGLGFRGGAREDSFPGMLIMEVGRRICALIGQALVTRNSGTAQGV